MSSETLGKISSLIQENLPSRLSEAEKTVAKAYLDGTIEDFNKYDQLDAQEVYRIVSMQEVFKTRKLNPLETGGG